MRHLVFLFIGMLCCVMAFGQTADTLGQQDRHSFTSGAQLWARGEWRDGALPNKDGYDEAMFIMESTLLQFSYKHKGMEIKVAPRHSGVWGADGNGSFSLDEGWFALRHPNGLFVQLGRQRLAYDDERIIGNNDWVMTASRHDVLKAGYDGKKHRLHLLYAFNQNDVNTNGGTYFVDGGQPYKSMQTLWYHFSPVQQLGASLIFMNTGMQDMVNGGSNSLFQQLYGGFVDWSPGPLSFQASYYRQSGVNEYKVPIRAWMTSFEAAWHVSQEWNLNAGYFYLSGDDDYFFAEEGVHGVLRQKEINGFNPIFGTHHEFYGAMDFFYVEDFYAGNSPGLQDLHAGVNWHPWKNLALEAEYHCMATSVPVRNAATWLLGHEIELSTAWHITKNVSLQAGYSYMKGTETMTVLKRTSDKNRLKWGWLMLVVTPSFFSTDW